MAISQIYKKRLQELKSEYDSLKKGKESLLALIDEAEIPEAVYNSNAIENSTLTLKETERILLEMDLSRDVSVREIFETKNLARVVEYIRKKSYDTELNEELILLLHKMLLTAINDDIAGRYRAKDEYVRVGTHIAPAPEKVSDMTEELFNWYASDLQEYFLEKIARFHLEFEIIHPFVDGNGRIGRIVINYQLQRFGFPSVIIRNKEKQDYYDTFSELRVEKKTDGMEKILTLALLESLRKRLAYLKGLKIISLSDYAKQQERSASAIFNAAKRQTIAAFREKGIWKIGT